MNEIYQAIIKRRSIRRFKPQKISRRLMRLIVNAGRLAPSAANLQPLEFLLVEKEGLKEKVFSSCRWASYIYPQGTPSFWQRPSFYVVVLVNKKRAKFNPAYDVGAAVENMLLAAFSFNLASCWIASLDKTKLRKHLGIPAAYEIDSLAAFGVSAQKSKVVEDENNVKYWQDEKGNFFVPKRPLKNVIHYNRYEKQAKA